jgi:dihydroorotase
MSLAPARIAGYEGHGGRIEVGAPAHLTVINPTQSYRVDRDLVASRSRNTPFHGMELSGVVQATFFRGIPTYLGGQLTSIHSNGSNSQTQGGSSR